MKLWAYQGTWVPVACTADVAKHLITWPGVATMPLRAMRAVMCRRRQARRLAGSS